MDYLLPDDDWALVRRVTIDHADGWSSVYLHNMVEPHLFPIVLKVAIGEVIGLAGRSFVAASLNSRNAGEALIRRGRANGRFP